MKCKETTLHMQLVYRCENHTFTFKVHLIGNEQCCSKPKHVCERNTLSSEHVERKEKVCVCVCAFKNSTTRIRMCRFVGRRWHSTVSLSALYTPQYKFVHDLDSTENTALLQISRCMTNNFLSPFSPTYPQCLSDCRIKERKRS